MIILKVKGSNMIKANNQRKKLNLKGLNSLLNANLPAKKLPDQKKEDSVNKNIASNNLFVIFLFI